MFFSCFIDYFENNIRPSKWDSKHGTLNTNYTCFCVNIICNTCRIYVDCHGMCASEPYNIVPKRFDLLASVEWKTVKWTHVKACSGRSYISSRQSANNVVSLLSKA